VTGDPEESNPVSLRSPVPSCEPPRSAPGRGCPLHYRYAPADLAREPDLRAETLYVIGGLYGNRQALATALSLAAAEQPGATLVFNGDFNWFNIDDAGFAAVNGEVLRHAAMRGNVETELASDDGSAGCGCGYPDWVDDAEVERSNRIIGELRTTARRFPALRSQLASLPMHLVADVGGLRVAIVHGDAESLAGWNFSQEALAGPDATARLSGYFDRANARVFACSHTCLPVVTDCETRQGRCVLVNNGAAGMPNFSGTAYGLITRIAATPRGSAQALYGTRLGPLYIDALPLHYSQALWLDEFRADWPPGTPAYESYFRRVVNGPAYSTDQALRWRVSLPDVARPTAANTRGARNG
jgi:hypothetical protein